MRPANGVLRFQERAARPCRRSLSVVCEDTCSWPGITRDWRSRVIALNITTGGELKLGGEITTEIGDLTEVRVLSVLFHSFTDEIPLRDLDVAEAGGFESQREFGVGLPSAEIRAELECLNFSTCVNLEVLNLSNNKLNGTIPGFFGGIFAS